MIEKDLIDAAQGAAPCDLNLANCVLVDLYRGEMRRGSTVSIRKGRIAGVNDGLRAERTVDLKGLYLSPGLIDAHVHIESSLLSPPEYARVVAPHGTTAVVADPHEIANVMGYEGMRYMLASSEGLPIDVFLMVPSCVPATEFDTAGAALYASDMHPFLREARVLGLGEVMNYPGVLYKDQKLLDKIALFRDAGKPVDGHAPGLTGGALSAYIAAGIGSDHECTSPEEAAEKLAKGMYVMLREGSTAKDLRTLLPAVNPRTASRVLICSDDRHANDLVDEGHMDHALRLLLAGGVSPIDAFTIACLNPARWFNIPGAGAIAPGFKADLVAFESLEDFRAKLVFKDGVLVAEDGRLVADTPTARPPTRDSVNIKWLTEEDFRIPAQGRRIRAIEASPGSIITGERVLEARIEEGLCVSDLGRDLVKIFVIERHTGSGNIGKGFITGLGLKRGAVGATVSHDSHNMIVAGVDDASIFKAARHLNKMKGGFVFAVGDEVILDLPLPVAGLMSDRDASFVVDRLRAFEALFEREGLALASPLMTLSFMALPVIPSLKITDRGLIDVVRFSPVGLFVD
ncbi:MAG TPA: adenine deaminase [Rectinemataceae bacterium]|nr:adenine deaminase [Rectinemataceae bacterium]